MPNIKLEVKPDATITKEVLAKSIVKLSDSSNELLNSGLNKKAILVLLCDATKMSKRSVTRVLDAIGQLRADYTHL